MSNVLHVTILLLCQLGLHVLMGLIRSFHRSRPIVQLSLIHLVNADLSDTYTSLITTSLVINTLQSLEIALPHVPAMALTQAMLASLLAFILYMALAIVAHYLHVLLQTVDLFEDEHRARNVLRTVILISSLAFVSWELANGSRPTIYYALMRTPALENPHLAGLRLMLSLGIASMTVNLIFR